MVEEVKNIISKSDVNDKVEFTFIDLMEDDLSPYAAEKKVIDKGYQLPITFVAGKPAFSGKIDTNRLYMVLKKL
ncbi:hypothetical protein [Alkaliphilus peptidifermentans]|uniref:Uncharacterized protein n=1 Tax=Alkaliphilus peptidifermentans DSM 18978 TaxID=1120976 RepID=A0A1G5AKB2_9FIRM|nr:hypothetical protein [Alkaliphilus peptidifermentans]SCX78322.1 hypothetical protein SAMN03080606_00175 [Alkaliphilus peptidifermentans DSM 18978]